MKKVPFQIAIILDPQNLESRLNKNEVRLPVLKWGSLGCIDFFSHQPKWQSLRMKPLWFPELLVSWHLLTCLLRNLYAGQEATARTGHGTTDWFQIGKGVCQGCILFPCLFNLYAEYIMRNAGLKKHKLESRLLGEISITSDMQMTPPLWPKMKSN